ncbi:radical SAM protein [Clostridium hydrogenum]|uniref:radical SAM protein n=1 Tax=Clostridium hydrogenum TaxID=2855764 RepID=UPI001F1AF705|nr:radical SAM protein [Clostridium hydrogenum]
MNNIISYMEKGVKEALVKAVTSVLDKNPEKNVDKLFQILDHTIKDQESKESIETVYDLYKNNPAIHELAQNILSTTDKNCLKKFFGNFFANAVWYGGPIRDKIFSEQGTKLPFTILISPSMRCTLKCTGCYAAKYSKKDDIPREELERIIKEARELGIYYIIILGGEPFINDYMLDIYEEFNDVLFTPFTNGQLINEKIADRLKKLGNVIPMFSLEGFEKETDGRRGKGVFQGVMRAMDLLHERGVLFGVSSAVNRINLDVVTSDEFIDLLVKKGAKMSWYFLYMPVGESPDVNLMLTSDQRLALGERTRKIRVTKPYFTIDFFNDAPYVGGCIAGKYYCHINSKEEVEPCIFAHFSTFNLKGKPLIDAFKTEFFKTLREIQPYNKNMLRPCMMIDNTNVVREVVAKVGAHTTDPSAEKMLHDAEFMSELDKLAEDFKPKADKAWKEIFNEKGNDKMAKG